MGLLCSASRPPRSRWQTLTSSRSFAFVGAAAAMHKHVPRSTLPGQAFSPHCALVNSNSEPIWPNKGRIRMARAVVAHFGWVDFSRRSFGHKPGMDWHRQFRCVGLSLVSVRIHWKSGQEASPEVNPVHHPGVFLAMGLCAWRTVYVRLA